ncbi:MAG: hypothetical protein F6K65_10015 [Moorea sp. SIO3C2]|nr:hypothetical protein [Moorena sp. SIO3C2]
MAVGHATRSSRASSLDNVRIIVNWIGRWPRYGMKRSRSVAKGLSFRA